MVNAKSASELPRNRRQIYNSHHKVAPSQGSSKADPIFELEMLSILHKSSSVISVWNRSNI